MEYMNAIRKIVIIIIISTCNLCYCQIDNTIPKYVLKGHKHKVQRAFFSSDSKLIVSHGWDNTVRIWDVQTFSEIKTLKGHTDQVWCAKLSPDNKLIASGSMDRTFIIWDVATGEKLQQVQIDPYFVITKGAIPELDGKIQNSIYSVSFSPNGKKLAIASADKLVRIWDIENSVFTDTLDVQNTSNSTWCSYSPCGEYLISGSAKTWNEKGVKVIWETETYSEIARIVMTGDILFTENNEMGIYAGNNSMNYYDLSNGSLIRNITFPDFKGYFNISPDKKLIVSCNEDSYIILRDIKTQKVIWTYKNEKLEIHIANFSPDGKYLIAGTPESNILVWEMDSIIN